MCSQLEVTEILEPIVFRETLCCTVVVVYMHGNLHGLNLSMETERNTKACC